MNNDNKKGIFLKIGVVVFLLYFHAKWFLNKNYFLPLIDYVNLAFHEAGHIFTSFLGKFIHMAGGTFFQILLPSLCAYHFYREKNNFGFQLSLWWVGENLLNISIYIADANKLQLPLVGGGEHDWEYLLSRLGLLNSCDGIAKVVFFIGTIIMLYAVYLIIKDVYISFSDANNYLI